MRFTSVTLTSIMLFGGTVQVFANTINDKDNTSGNNTSSGSSNTNTDTDAYSDWLNDIISLRVV